MFSTIYFSSVFNESEINALLGAFFRAINNYIIACLFARPIRAITNASHVTFFFGAIMNVKMEKTC